MGNGWRMDGQMSDLSHLSSGRDLRSPTLDAMELRQRWTTLIGGWARCGPTIDGSIRADPMPAATNRCGM